MTLKDIVGRSEEIGAPNEEWPFRVAALAKGLETELAQPQVLRDIADQLLVLVERLGCEAVAGASYVGAQLAGVLVARSTNGLQLFAPDKPVDNVMVLDGVLATGTQIIRSVNSAREAGAKRVVGAALLADHEALRLCREVVRDEVLALEEY